jgi:hypothetical protein
LFFDYIAQPELPESKKIELISGTNPEYEQKDGGEIDPVNVHRGESNLSVEANVDQEEQELNAVQEDNASNTSSDGVSQDENGFESANDQPDDNSEQLRDDGNTDNEHSNGSGDGGGGGFILGYDEDRRLY